MGNGTRKFTWVITNAVNSDALTSVTLARQIFYISYTSAFNTLCCGSLCN